MKAATGFPATPVDDHTFVAKNSDGEEITINIDNAYAAYLAKPDDLDSLIQRFTSIFSASEQAAGLDQLTVIVRPSDYVTQSLSPRASLNAFPSPRPLAGDLSVFLAIDSPETIRTASLDDLKKWGLTEAEAWNRAISSIKARIGPLGFAKLEGEPDSSVMVANSGLAPSILADPVFCGPAAPSGLSEAVVLLLSRDAFLLGFPGEKRSIRTFWKIAKDQIQQGLSMSRTAITCEGGQWVVAPTPK